MAQSVPNCAALAGDRLIGAVRAATKRRCKVSSEMVERLEESQLVS
jgi:hypothetical protein